MTFSLFQSSIDDSGHNIGHRFLDQTFGLGKPNVARNRGSSRKNKLNSLVKFWQSGAWIPDWKTRICVVGYLSSVIKTLTTFNEFS